MNQFFARLLLLDEGGLMLISIGLIVFGGFVGFQVAKPERRFSRIQYLWAFAGLNLALSISTFGWLLASRAAPAGILSFLVMGMAVCLVVFGVANYYASAARSIDMTGDVKKAWMGFVPIANLWLIFSKSQNRPEGAAKPSHLRALVVNPLLVIGALITLFFGQGVMKIMEETASYAVTPSPELTALFASAQTLEQSLISEAKASSAELPIRLDEITVFRAIEADGKSLILHHDLEREIGSFNGHFKAGLAERQCSPEMFAYDLSRGGKIVYIYWGPAGNMIERFEITQADC